MVTLAAKEGIWPEASSVAPFAAIERLRADGTDRAARTLRGIADGKRPQGPRADRGGAARGRRWLAADCPS